METKLTLHTPSRFLCSDVKIPSSKRTGEKKERKAAFCSQSEEKNGGKERISEQLLGNIIQGEPEIMRIL